MKPLNWKEIAALAELLASEVEGVHVERVVVPERPLFPDGFLKGEWMLRLTGKRKEWGLIISVRPRHPYLVLCEERRIPKSAAEATRSGYDLALAKHLKGAKLERIEALPRERTVALWFGGSQPLGLLLSLIPATPEAILVSTAASQPPWPVIARSRPQGPATFSPPDGSRAPEDVPLREELVSSLQAWRAAVDRELETEAFALRLQESERAARETLKASDEHVRSAEKSLEEASAEQDWSRLGDLLKASLGSSPPLIDGSRTVVDYENGEEIRIPCDPKLSAQEQVEKFYTLGRRKKRRADEARSRLALYSEARAKAHAAQESLQELKALARPDWPALEKIRAELGISAKSHGRATSGSAASWPGRSFVSSDGLSIWVGRNRTENLELTFRHARGNDFWMHIRGKPGAHVVIPLSSGKSVPLETLLDAATLAIFYSGGESWGKTEVDYTLKKHVRRIKASNEASYTHSKTLITQFDATRLKRLSENQPTSLRK